MLTTMVFPRGWAMRGRISTLPPSRGATLSLTHSKFGADMDTNFRSATPTRNLHLSLAVAVAALACLALLGCGGQARSTKEVKRLPTGAVLDPEGISVALGSMPVGMIFSPDSTRAVVVLSGYRDQGIQVVD